MGRRRIGKGQIRGCQLSSELLLVLLLWPCVFYDVVAVPWTVAFGNCSFAGDNVIPVPLVRTGSCLTQAGALNLGGKCITSLPTDAFQDMPLMTSVPGCICVGVYLSRHVYMFPCIYRTIDLSWLCVCVCVCVCVKTCVFLLRN
jgi:hypothetical protein